jgi:7-cyano-7-deazaguanine synthase
MKDSAIIYSGGLDSTVLLYKHQDRINQAISFNYGSKHNLREIEYAKWNCGNLKIDHKIIEIDFDSFGIKSDLLQSGGDIPDGHYEDVSMKKTVVPLRNGIMLMIVSAIAESNDLRFVYIANHAGDHAIYPDCRNEFIEPLKTAIQAGTYNNIKVCSPCVNKTKRDIALIGKELGVDFTKTYSCYKGGELQCGKCSTCCERIFSLYGFDVTKYLDHNLCKTTLKQK